jgi:hypothetical protein
LYAHDSESIGTVSCRDARLFRAGADGAIRGGQNDNGTNLDFMDTMGEITSQHYAFMVENRISMRSSSGFVRES